MVEILAGFAIGTVVGFVLGVVLAVSEAFERITYPLVIAFQSVPKIVLAPLIITWFGYGIESKIAMAVVISFFPVLLNTMVGLGRSRVRDSAYAVAARISRAAVLEAVPPARGSADSGGCEKTGLTFAVVGAIVAEFVGASEGLGFLIHQYSFQLRIDRVFAVIVVMSAIGSASTSCSTLSTRDSSSGRAARFAEAAGIPVRQKPLWRRPIGPYCACAVRAAA